MSSNEIRQGQALPGPGVESQVPSYDYAHLIGKRLILEGSGENVAFEKNLPRPATVVRQLSITDWGSDWLQVKFDEAFPYRRGIFDFKPMVVDSCLIRGRWLGHPIGGEFCPVFVLLDDKNVLDGRTEWKGKDFYFVTWGEARLETAGKTEGA